MADLKGFSELAARDFGLSVAVTVRADGTPQATVVNAGVVPDPVTGVEVVGFVSPSATAKLGNLRVNPAIALTVRSGWEWMTVEGTARLIGPDDPAAGIDGERQRSLIREIFAAAGVVQDWETYEQVMREKRGTLVFVTPSRVYSNPFQPGG